MVLEAAVNGRADALVTFNVRDFGKVPSRFGIEVMLPPEVMARNQTMTKTKTYPLRLPRSLKESVERLSEEEGTSINQSVATAVAEKVSAMQTARFFQERKARADFKAFDRIMKRRGRKATAPR